MGLISKEVEITLSPSSIKYYEELNYNIERRINKYGRLTVPLNMKMIVKVENLPINSHVYVEVKCDCKDCKDPIKLVQWNWYVKHIQNDGKYYCHKCSINLYGTEKRLKTVLEKSKSFEQWCYDNLNIDYANEILSRWDTETNKCLPSEVCYSSTGFNKKGYFFKCLKHRCHKSELNNINTFTSNFKKGTNSNSLKCNQCNSIGQYLLDTYGENAIESYWSNKNKISPWEIDAKSNKEVWIKCIEKEYHEDYNVSPYNFSRVSGNKCPFCSHLSGKVHPLDSLGKYLEDKGLLYLWSEKNKKSPYEYSKSSTKKVYWRCFDERHEDYYKIISDATRYEFRCPECTSERNESFLQEKVGLYLNELEYTVLHEHKCSITPINPKTKKKLPFDNEIVELKLIIEVHGLQHYKLLTGFAWIGDKTPEECLHYQKLKDRYKRIYAKSNGYNFLEVPYWTDDKDETWKQLIDNKIKEILKTNKSKGGR